MPIEGALVARGRNILALYVSPGSNFVQVSKKLLPQIPIEHDTKKSYTHQGFMFHFVVERGITYLCMSDSQMGFRAPYALLYDLISKVKANYPSEVSTAAEIPPLSRIIKEQTIFFNDARNSDKSHKLRMQVDEVKNQMISNVDKVIARGEKIEEVLEKTQELQENTYSFKVKAKEVKRKMWWKNLKVKICCIIFLVLLLAGGVAISLWAAGVFGKPSPPQPAPSPSPQNTTTITTTTTRPTIVTSPSRSAIQPTRITRTRNVITSSSTRRTTTTSIPPIPTSETEISTTSDTSSTLETSSSSSSSSSPSSTSESTSFTSTTSETPQPTSMTSSTSVESTTSTTTTTTAQTDSTTESSSSAETSSSTTESITIASTTSETLETSSTDSTSVTPSTSTSGK